MSNLNFKDFAKSLTSLLPFMEGREKGNTKDLRDKVVTIIDYGFLKDTESNDNKEYVGFIIKEDDANFYFGGSVLTQNMKEIDANGFHDNVVTEGLPVRMSEKKAKKSGRDYTTVEFFPTV